MSNPVATPKTSLSNGWIVYADWTKPSGRFIKRFATTWIVPPPPLKKSGQKVYLFNGIQNSNKMIFQPVLQWGSSAVGGGDFWSVSCWYAGEGGEPAKYSQLVPVNSSQSLTGVIELVDFDNIGSSPVFSYICYFEGIDGTKLTVNKIQELSLCFEVLEAYGLQTQDNYPDTDKTVMGGIEIEVDNGEADLNWKVNNRITDCGQHIDIVSNNSPGGEVDIFY